MNQMFSLTWQFVLEPSITGQDAHQRHQRKAQLTSLINCFVKFHRSTMLVSVSYIIYPKNSLDRKKLKRRKRLRRFV